MMCHQAIKELLMSYYELLAFFAPPPRGGLVLVSIQGKGAI